ncbi:hypothetical protein [Neobacillus sp. PS3-40]|uniref:hypothetical protein n=1 Tax=Neobacillus sp. PS3-40 TaxID=3070679 RepID=UPI0027E1FFF2|nr:hypothetical protein [Neobacillus sp. PS3-40]WML44661.1 hypothetical protein RCG20_01740 [Neobacillus sp. PS3-40]
MDILGNLAENIFHLMPSRKTRKINQNLRQLRNEVEFKRMENRIGKDEVREFLYEKPIVTILSDTERKTTFFHDFEKLCEKVGV